MINCRCPKCSEVHNAKSSHFGELATCPNCGLRHRLGTEHLAHFALPEIVAVSLKDQLAQSVQLPNVVISIEYGYSLPPLQTDRNGQLSITRDMFEKAEHDEVSTGLQDHKGDYSLNRYIRVAVLSPGELKHLAEARESSGWPGLFWGSRRSCTGAFTQC